LAMASSQGSELKPLVALDIGHTIAHPGAYSARGVGEYYFNRKIVKALYESLENSGKVDAFIINPEGKPISLQGRTRQAAKRNAVLFLGAAMVARGFSPTLHHAEQIPGESRNLVDEDFGLYEFDNLIVLKTAAMPAALLECGVIVSRNEEASLQTPEIQHRIADAAAEAIVQSLGSAGLARHQLQLAPANASEPRPSHKSRRQRKAS
jgi:N-acetylmuramoyl-L-alanine amidase